MIAALLQKIAQLQALQAGLSGVASSLSNSANELESGIALLEPDFKYDDEIADANFNRNTLAEIREMISTINGSVMASISQEIAACQARIEAIRAEEARRAAAAAAAAAAASSSSKRR